MISEDISKCSTAAETELRCIIDSMASLGVTAETLEFAANSPVVRRDKHRPLDDDEWQILRTILPNDPHQANAMDNRTFVNAVLEAMKRGGRWTAYPKKGACSDAVRRRFGRWAHLGVWQRLSADVNSCNLCDERKAEFATISERAERLRENNGQTDVSDHTGKA